MTNGEAQKVERSEGQMLSPAHVARRSSLLTRRDLLAMSVAIGGCVEAVSGQTPPASDLGAQLRGQTQQLMDALAAGDRSPWQRFIAEDVVFLTEDGTRKSKADLVAEIRAFPPEIWGRIRVTDYVVVRNDRVAVATYVAD